MLNGKLYPPGVTIAGVNQIIRFYRHMQADLLGILRGWAQRYGDIVLTRAGRELNYNVFHPDMIHEVLVEHAPSLHKTPDYTDPKLGLARFLGGGLLTSDGEFWKRQRKLVAPALHARRVESYAETMVTFTLRALEGWHSGEILDVDGAMTRLTLDIVAKTLFDTDVAEDAATIGRAMADLQRAFGTFTILPAWVLTPGRQKAARAARDLDSIVYRLIDERRGSGEDRGDLLSMLLLAVDEAGGMTRQQARDEAVTLFLAGHETTANALKWTWYLLSEHPAVEAKLHAELDRALGGQPPTLADLERLPYTEMVIKEAMRLYPPAYAFSRLAMADLTVGGYYVPKGSALHLSPFVTHRDPRWFPEPDRFDPDRFAPEREKELPRYAYFPFGGGPRVCIGNAFAMMEARLIVATIAGRYRLVLAPGQRVEPEPLITLVPKHGLKMRVIARQPLAQPELATPATA